MPRAHRAKYFEAFRGHTVLKHGVLDRYVKAWIQVLGRKHEHLWIVDGFAGKGIDETGQPGSPLLLASSAAALRHRGVDVQLIAVEADAPSCRKLKETLAPFDVDAGGETPVARVFCGTLDAVADKVFGLVGDDPVFAFLDPFGADGLSLGVITRVLANARGEIFALFAHGAIARHLAVLRTEPSVARLTRAAETGTLSLFPDLEADWLAAEFAKAEQSDAGLLPTKEAARRILRQLFGSDAEVEKLLAVGRSAQTEQIVRAYLEILRARGATYTTRIAIFDEQQRCTYFLIHAAKDALAPYKMKEAFSGAIGTSNLPTSTKRIIGLAHETKIAEVAEAVRRHFAGQEVLWTDKRKSAASVRGFALRSTPLFPHQAWQLKSVLIPYLIAESPMQFRFPAISE